MNLPFVLPWKSDAEDGQSYLISSVQMLPPHGPKKQKGKETLTTEISIYPI